MFLAAFGFIFINCLKNRKNRVHYD